MSLMLVVLTHRKLLLTNWEKLVMLLGSMWDLSVETRADTHTYPVVTEGHINTVHIHALIQGNSSL